MNCQRSAATQLLTACLFLCGVREPQAVCQVAQANAQTKAWQRVCLSHPDKIELKKSSFPSENKKYATAQTDMTKTMKRSIDNGLQGRWTEGQHITAVWRNGGFSASMTV